MQDKEIDTNLLYALSDIQRDSISSALDGHPIVLALTLFLEVDEMEQVLKVSRTMDNEIPAIQKNWAIPLTNKEA